jgi:dinuclear metal center YbgI/SA1388 family protein
MVLHELVTRIAEVLPPETAMKGDRIGLQIESGRTQISTVLVTMEVTDAVVQEAVERGAECIVAFHPLIFAPLTALVAQERVGRLCARLIKHDIALVVAHTNFDAFPDGTSTLFARHLGFEVEGVLVPDATARGKERGFGMGIVAQTAEPMPADVFVAHVHGRSHAPVRHNYGKAEIVRRVAIVGGSGASFIDQAVAANADVFITADVKYHDFHRTEGIMMLIDPGHYEMEQFVPLGLASLLQGIAAATGEHLTIMRSHVVPNPVRYYPNTEKYLHDQLDVLKH